MRDEAATARGTPAESIEPFGEGAWLVRLAEDPVVRAARRARALAGAIAGLRVTDERWAAPIPAAASVLAAFDPLALTPGDAHATLDELMAALPADPGPGPAVREHAIDVRYGGDDGPDLGEVARMLGLAPADVVALHSDPSYEVLFLGFSPGFAYLGELADPLILPRRATPRTRVPAGSVAIAGPYSAIYPSATPGGWWLLGRTEARLFDPAAGSGEEPAALFGPGDSVRFVPR